MSEPRRINIGDVLDEFPAGSFNALVDDYYSRKGSGGPRGRTPQHTIPALFAVNVYNASGADVEPGDVLQIDGPVYDFEDDPHLANSVPTFKCITPDGKADRFVVMRSFVDDEKIGGKAGVLGGPCVVKVTIGSLGHTCCVPSSSVAQMVSSSGGHPMLLKEDDESLSLTRALIIKSLGGGGSVNFSRARTVSTGTPATGWEKEDAGSVQVELATASGWDGPFTVLVNYFDEIPDNIPGWTFQDANGDTWFVNAGCNVGPS